MKSTIILVPLLIVIIALFAQHGETSPIPHDRGYGNIGYGGLGYGGYAGGYGGLGGFGGYSYGHSHGGGYHEHSSSGTFYPNYRRRVLGGLVGSLLFG